ncbi:dynein associated protein domain-containing protein [Ditylenchus destructor]|uniref:Dynactin subunit 1 n=1 Tax=Ditylenchus destructor TaxID=166010 RepID=A0AAD4R896_9BILA|nr:dynein associated protein domain-containing protein [Ditylenchus destructor]
MATFNVGDLVETDKGSGKVAYVGKTQFAEGDWVGIVLEQPNGKNNGTVNDVSYFSCKDNYGIFVARAKVRLKQSTPRSKLQAPTASNRPPSALKSQSSTKITPGSTPKMTPSSSMERLDRQKSFGQRSGIPQLSSRAAPEPKIPEEKESKIPETTRRLSRVQNSGDSTASDHSAVRERISKIDENTPLNSSMYKLPETPLTSTQPIDDIEVDMLKREIKDLNEKLETLRFKRKEDQEKIREYDRSKIEIERLMVFKTEMTAAHSALKKQNEELQRRLEDMQFENEQNSDLNNLMQQLELTALDKEMAEEKAEGLQEEVKVLNNKCEDLESQISMLKTQLQRNRTVGAGDAEIVTNSVEMQQIQHQNEKLTEVVQILREHLNQLNGQVTSLKKELELTQAERDQLNALCDVLEKDRDAAKEAVSSFQEQVDAAMGSETMIATLTDKNLNLEEKIEKLEEDLSGMETLRAIDEEIIEASKETERELRVDIDRQHVQISELKKQILDYDRRIEDFERSILKFRQKNSELNEEIQHLKDEILILKAEENSESADNESYSLKTVNINRTFAEVVEADLKSIELEYARQHATYLKSFLPDNFTKAGGDNDCVLICVLFPRLATKAINLIKLLNMKYPPVPNGLRREHITLSHKAEQWAHVKKFCYSLHALNAILKKFEAVSKNCSVERLSRLAMQQLEISGQERNLDQYFELLRQNRLDENTSVDNLERIVNFFQKVFSTHLNSENISGKEAMANTIHQLKEGLAWIQFNCQRLKYFLQPSEDESNDFTKLVNDVVTLISESESLAIRSLNRIPAENDLMLTAETNDKIFSAVAALEKVARIVHNTCMFAASQLTTIDVEGFSSAQLKEMLHSSVEKAVGQTDSSKAGVILNDAITAAEGLRWQNSKKDEEILKLQMLIKAKEGDISTLKLRLEMADNQMKSSDKSGDAQMQRLQQRYDELQEDFVKQKSEYEKNLEQLQKKLEHVEHDRQKQKELARDFSKKALFANMSQNILALGSGGGASPITPPIVPAMVNFGQEMVLLEKELQATLNDLKWAEQRIRVLEADNTKLTIERLNVVNPPDVVCGVYSLKKKPIKNEDELELEKMLKETDALLTESNSYLIEPFDPKEQENYRKRVAYINDRVESLNFRFHRCWNRIHPGEEYPRLIKDLFARNSVPSTKEMKKPNVPPKQRCTAILNKWNNDLKDGEKWYSSALTKGVA